MTSSEDFCNKEPIVSFNDILDHNLPDTYYNTDKNASDGLINNILQNRKQLKYAPHEFYYQHNVDALDSVIINRIIYLLRNDEQLKLVQKLNETYRQLIEEMLKNTFLEDWCNFSFREKMLSDFKQDNVSIEDGIKDYLTRHINRLGRGKCSFFREIRENATIKMQKVHCILYIYIVICENTITTELWKDFLIKIL